MHVESGTRNERLRADRQRDLRTSSKLPELCSKRGLPRNKLWPPPLSKEATTPMAKLNGLGYAITYSNCYTPVTLEPFYLHEILLGRRYYDALKGLGDGTSLFSPHTCGNCHQRSTDHAPERQSSERLDVIQVTSLQPMRCHTPCLHGPTNPILHACVCTETVCYTRYRIRRRDNARLDG